jgi:hypothetical protein
VTEEQKTLFPASVVYWLAESRFEPSFLRYNQKLWIGAS